MAGYWIFWNCFQSRLSIQISRKRLHPISKISSLPKGVWNIRPVWWQKIWIRWNFADRWNLRIWPGHSSKCITGVRKSNYQKSNFIHIEVTKIPWKTIDGKTRPRIFHQILQTFLREYSRTTSLIIQFIFSELRKEKTDVLNSTNGIGNGNNNGLTSNSETLCQGILLSQAGGLNQHLTTPKQERPNSLGKTSLRTAYYRDHCKLLFKICKLLRIFLRSNLYSMWVSVHWWQGECSPAFFCWAEWEYSYVG